MFMLNRKKARWGLRPSKRIVIVDKPAKQYQLGSVVVQVWKRKSRWGKTYRTISIARWLTNGKRLWLSKHLYPSDFEDLIELLCRHQNDLVKR